MTNCVWGSTVHANGDCIWTEIPQDFNPAERCVWTSTVHPNGGCIWIENILDEDGGKGGGYGPDFEGERWLAKLRREDEEILAVIMAYTLH